MSGHSKWHSIKHKKAATDAAKGKVFTRHAKIIAIAARGGGDPEMNPTLRLAIDNAKKDNMPNNNIERAIKKGTGEDKDAAEIMEITYEGYGPNGVAIIVKTLTDNKNRTVANIKHTFSKNGGNLGENGSVAWMFALKGVIEIDCKEDEKEEVELLAIDAGAEDIVSEDDFFQVYTAPEDLHKVKKNIEEKGIKVGNAQISYLAKNTVIISDESQAKKVLKLVSSLEEDEDVDSVAANFDIPEEILDKI